ncbi:uncharacterized protein LOC132282660 isoform X2 [Cornus florida]|uniref:uncharacterized protein LOC132282660 isoform X2 n=1 Tax=Cornus florida TaxID=4283 RepID=UPI0028A075A6|nr:uncharacterized protein LOC132282660 isoform X2 [Cornus florida]
MLGSKKLQSILNGGCYLHVAQEPSSAARGMIPEFMFPKTSTLSSYNLGNAELGSSFLSLLSGPPSLVQGDLQQLSIPKPFNASTIPVKSNGVVVSAAGSSVSFAPPGLLSENPRNQNPKMGGNLCPIVSSRARASSNHCSASGLQDVHQAANLNLQSSELAKVVIHGTLPVNEKVNDISSVSGGWLTTTTLPNVGKFHGTNIQASQKVPLQSHSSVSHHSSTNTSDCPRVFCLGASGDLLLSNTGLLGIVCSCHGWHMSISKFCEHSGLCNVNPGDAVRLDSGETIAYWRKLYFHKFGIRVPDDHSGWDWPEGFSATAGLVKTRTTLPNMSRNSDLSNLIGSSGASVRSGWSWNDACPKNPYTGQKLVNEVSQNEKLKNAQDGFNFLHKGFIGTSKSNLHPMADNQNMECPVSRYSTASKLVGLTGPDNGSQSISAYIDSISKSKSLFVSSTNLLNLTTLGVDSSNSRFNYSKEGDIVDREAVPSNFELRLGQPSQPIQTRGNPVLPAFGSHLFCTVGDPQKSLLAEQLMHNTSNSVVMERRRQFIRCAADTSNSSARREQSLLNTVNNASGVSNAVDAAKIEHLKGDTAKVSGISMLLPHLNTPLEGKLHFKNTNNVVNSSEDVMPMTHCESRTLNCDPIKFPWNRGGEIERKLIINELGLHKRMDKGKAVGDIADDCHVATESSFGFPSKHIESSSSFGAVGNGTGNHTCSVVHDKGSHQYQFPGMLPYACDARNALNYSGKKSCLGNNGHVDRVFLRSISSSMDSGLIVPSQEVPMGVSTTTSISVPRPTSALLNKEGSGISPYLLDDNLRNLAFRHILESSNQNHSFAPFGTNQEKGRFINSCGVKIQGSIVHPTMSNEQRHGPDTTSKQDACELAMKSLQSGVTCWMSHDSENFAPVAGLNKWCDFSTFSQANSVHPKGLETQYEISRSPHPNNQSSSRSENTISPSSELVKCCQRVPCTYFPSKCICAFHANHVVSCDSKGKTSLDAVEEHAGSICGKASLLFASRFDEEYNFPKKKVVSLGQNEKLEGQIPKKAGTHGFQWRDVPRKATEICSVACMDQPADLLDGSLNVEDQISVAATECFNRSAQDAECLKEQQMSNVSSGCSAPAVTQASIEVNNMDSCTVDAGDTRYTKDLVVDEGSGIDKCWSSDDALDSERSAECFQSCKIKSINESSSKALPNQFSRTLIDDLRFRDSFWLKKVQNKIHTGNTIHEKTNHAQKSESGFKTGKRKQASKWKMRDASFSSSGFSSSQNESPKCIGNAEWHSSSSSDMQMPLRSDQGISHNCACSAGPSFKRRRSGFSSSKTMSRKRDLHRLYIEREGENDYQTQLKVNGKCVEIPEASGGKKLRSGRTALKTKQFRMQEQNCAEVVNFDSAVRMISTYDQPLGVCNGRERPVVAGKYGVISNGNSSKPVKIVLLSKIFKVSTRCELTENDEFRLNSVKKLRKRSVKGGNGCFAKLSSFRKKGEGEGHDAMVCSELDPDYFMEDAETACFGGGKKCDDESYMLEKERYDGSVKNRNIPSSFLSTRLKTKSKEIRKRSLYELTAEGNGSCNSNFSPVKISKCEPQTKGQYLGKLLKNTENGKCLAEELYGDNKSTKEHQCQSSTLGLGAFCCVCGSSNKDEINCLVECSRCLIRVHQACYGVSRVPKAQWYCRPCRTSSKNIVCVLCGYGGGAMTRALRSHNIVKSLLKAWNVVTESGPENSISPSEALEDQLSKLSSSSIHDSDSFHFIRPVRIESSSTAAWKIDPQKRLESVKDSSRSSGKLKVDNNITAGVLDSTVQQWVHMVCGLWTPGTRCPNVDTMSAFDVSGAACPKVNVVCSMCNRPGGSCIKCRVMDCSVQFHPWCAHQKGLLQSEVEGVDDENVGFYGRCVLHATYHQCDSDGDPVDTEIGHPGKKDTCARTVGFKGRKQEGFQHRLNCQSSGSGGCLVPQEQLDAWIHINGQKCAKGLPKLPISDIEYDCRKEYTRYKQSKGWKHLVVYKSGIHALGLYTSQFISRGAMVVEYVGEIVGLRVADKRERDYQFGRKLQYKSACYFFRIDKEHIIDATRKGGIARFVNHSCLPNCVAKVISVRNEKKVVFFAERDIYPGEEITYDYHFNHEDEGKKIPCFCNSKNCRRYLN